MLIIDIFDLPYNDIGFFFFTTIAGNRFVGVQAITVDFLEFGGVGVIKLQSKFVSSGIVYDLKTGEELVFFQINIFG